MTRSVISDDKIREIFIANGFTIKEGLDDLKPYVYAAAHVLINEVLSAMFQAQSNVTMTDDTERLDWITSRSAHIGWDRDGDCCRVWMTEDEEVGPTAVTGWYDSAREAIDVARGIDVAKSMSVDHVLWRVEVNEPKAMLFKDDTLVAEFDSNKNPMHEHMCQFLSMISSVTSHHKPDFWGFYDNDNCRIDLCFTPGTPRSDGTYATAYYSAGPTSYVSVSDEREAFEAKYPPIKCAVKWDGYRYVVDKEWVNSYSVDRFIAKWEAWQARALHHNQLSEQVRELRRSLDEAHATISQRNAEIVELHRKLRKEGDV